MEPQTDKVYPYVIIVRGVTVYQGEDYQEAARALLGLEKDEQYRRDVITFFADGSKLEVYPMRADIRPNSLA